MPSVRVHCLPFRQGKYTLPASLSTRNPWDLVLRPWTQMHQPRSTAGVPSRLSLVTSQVQRSHATTAMGVVGGLNLVTSLLRRWHSMVPRLRNGISPTKFIMSAFL